MRRQFIGDIVISSIDQLLECRVTDHFELQRVGRAPVIIDYPRVMIMTLKSVLEAIGNGRLRKCIVKELPPRARKINYKGIIKHKSNLEPNRKYSLTDILNFNRHGNDKPKTE